MPVGSARSSILFSSQINQGFTNKVSEKDTGFKRPAKLQRKLDEIKV